MVQDNVSKHSSSHSSTNFRYVEHSGLPLDFPSDHRDDSPKPSKLVPSFLSPQRRARNLFKIPNNKKTEIESKSPVKPTLTPRSTKPASSLLDLVGDSASDLLSFSLMNEPDQSTRLDVDNVRDLFENKHKPAHVFPDSEVVRSPHGVCMQSQTIAFQDNSDLRRASTPQLLSIAGEGHKDNHHTTSKQTPSSATWVVAPRNLDTAKTKCECYSSSDLSRRTAGPRPTKSMASIPDTKITEKLNSNRPLLEVSPGLFLPLCKAEETVNEILSNKASHITCPSCETFYLCVHDATMVLCPTCSTISRQDLSHDLPMEKLGLGITVEMFSESIQ